MLSLSTEAAVDFLFLHIFLSFEAQPVHSSSCALIEITFLFFQFNLSLCIAAAAHFLILVNFCSLLAELLISELGVLIFELGF